MSLPTHDRCWTLKHLLGIISESDLRADQGSLAESRFSARQARFPLAPLAPVLEMGAGLLPRVPAIPLINCCRALTAACRLRRWAGRE